ncbi:MAG: hypothetical protein COU06_02680 [Candidatus Harrisonbacteria bacterium CG10_big_fil_rev_8_21_14_0_10_38_8]|uniref:DUF5679 domain-containing protein n=1 Tax=Candidatus Harrisonbacteria bacterium CG10_big_fil_rev_8_21_14_0_10_38_8 TaxID=1974582 RepID=A0A2M6WJJ5_9BACT|nr:MAG: hypothetical protein COU06_02680 [Candidatus Harrisonbacteria bacterium CG10_big_fil_rev_8_21_14_0_10_38_8]
MEFFARIAYINTQAWVKGLFINLLTQIMEAYCVKCRAKQNMVDAQEVTMKNGRQAMKGKCPVCGTGMFKITGKISAEK